VFSFPGLLRLLCRKDLFIEPENDPFQLRMNLAARLKPVHLP